MIVSPMSRALMRNTVKEWEGYVAAAKIKKR
jgi:hypothetical protein